jgi:Tfp pilus assembly protein PilV
MTLMEILIAVAFLAICAAAILDVVLVADTQGSYALRRTQVLTALQNEIEQSRGRAMAGTLTDGTTTTLMTLPGISGTVTVTTTTTLRSTSRTLWDISTSASWTEQAKSRTWNDTASLVSLIKQ